MAQCPNCHSEVKAEERFCGNCGSRIEQSMPPPASTPPANEPPRTTGKETIVLPKITDLTMQPPAPPSSSTDATIVAAPAPQPVPPVAATPPYQPPVAPTMIGGAAGVPPTQPAPPYSGDYSGSVLTPGSATPQPAAKSGSSVWKILGIIAGIVVLLCVVLSIGAYLVIRRAGTIAENTLATANAGLASGAFATMGAGLETAAAVPSPELFATIEADATAEPLATRTPKPVGAAAGSILYSDNFDNEQSSDFPSKTNDSSTYAFSDGAYSILVSKPNLLSWVKMKGDYGDASITVDANIDGPTASAAGLIFHYLDDKNFYIYSIDGEGRYELDVYKDDKPITLIDWTESSSIKPAGESNTLRVETQGDTIRLYANDQLLDEVSDSTIANGKAALVVNTFDDPNVTVKFDNLVVRGL
jgi:zinc-ribbon domain